MPRKYRPIRDLFTDTETTRSEGARSRVFSCNRCGWELVENATRFAKHITRCPQASDADRQIARAHLTELAPEKIEAINFTAEFTKAFSLGGKAHVRSLFEDTGKSRDGEKARLFRCLRCRFETTENATRFARHILKCPSATEKDRAVAQDHEALTKRRREMRLRQPLPPEAPDADSTPQIEENSSPHGDSVAAPGSKSSSRGGSSVDERLPSPASDTDINRGMNRTTAAGGASRVVSSAPSDDLFPGLDLEPGLPGSEARALSADFLDAAFVDSLASHAPWTGCGMPEGLGHPQATTESSEPMGRSTGGWQPVPDWGGQMPADGFGQSGGGGGLLDGHLLHSGLAPAQAAVAPSSVGLGGATLPGAGSGGWAGPQPWPWGSGGGSSPNPWAMGTGVSQPHPELSDASAGQYALPGKRQRPGGDQQEQRIRPDVSLSEWMEFRQWKQRQQQVCQAARVQLCQAPPSPVLSSPCEQRGGSPSAPLCGQCSALGTAG